MASVDPLDLEPEWPTSGQAAEQSSRIVWKASVMRHQPGHHPAAEVCGQRAITTPIRIEIASRLRPTTRDAVRPYNNLATGYCGPTDPSQRVWPRSMRVAVAASPARAAESPGSPSPQSVHQNDEWNNPKDPVKCGRRIAAVAPQNNEQRRDGSAGRKSVSRVVMRVQSAVGRAYKQVCEKIHEDHDESTKKILCHQKYSCALMTDW